MEFVELTAGDPAPWFRQRSFANPRYVFDSAAGRYLLLALVGSARDPLAQAAIATMRGRSDLFDDRLASAFTVTIDPTDESEKRLADSYPGHRIFWDFDGSVSRLYGALGKDAELGQGNVSYRSRYVLIDPTMRVIAVVPFQPDGSHNAKLLSMVEALPPPDRFAGFPLQAPILYLPRVFEPEFCKRLVDVYEKDGGQDSGFMREIDGRTVGVSDHSHKRRRDCTISDPELIRAIQARIIRRVVPEIAKVHQFHVTRMERYIVACYAADEGGHFSAHRDNTTKGTAHRRFAVSINLNDAFEGGEVSFPEYGPKSFKPGPGEAVVFSCSLLHAVSKVTAGKRFAFLPFLYDDAAAKLRAENQKFVGAESEAGQGTAQPGAPGGAAEAGHGGGG